MFEVVALCDVSAPILEKVGAHLPSARRYASHRELAADIQVEAVVIANPHVYHAEVALDAMRAGKHVLIEKPICVNLGEADALLECEASSQVVAQVGFMRRYAPAFAEAVERVSSVRAEIVLARVHDVIGANQIIIDSTSNVFRDPERVAGLAGTLEREMAAATALAIGDQSPAKARAYGLLLGLSSHDVSAMRELLGRLKGALRCQRSAGAPSLQRSTLGASSANSRRRSTEYRTLTRTSRSRPKPRSFASTTTRPTFGTCLPS